MNFACENCQRRYTIADEKVRDRAVKIRCKACQHLMSVGPLPAPAPEPEPAAENEDATRMVSLESLASLREQTKAPAAGAAPAAANPWDNEPTRAAPPAEAGALWFVSAHGKQIGPFSTTALGEKVRSGEIQPRNFVWKKGMGDWKRAVDVPELATVLSPGGAAEFSVPAVAPAVAPELPFDQGNAAETPWDSGGGEAQAYGSGAVEDTESVSDPRVGSAVPAQRDLDAQDLFADLELSKVIRAPQADLSYLDQPVAPDPYAGGETDLPASGDASEGDEQEPAAPSRASGSTDRLNHTPHRGTVAMTAGPQRSVGKGILATLLLLIAIIGTLALLIHERVIPAPPEIRDPIDAYWPVKSEPQTMPSGSAPVAPTVSPPPSAPAAGPEGSAPAAAPAAPAGTPEGTPPAAPKPPTTPPAGR